MDSKIKQFYSNANVLITGGTGFLGKVIIEKLLRTCDNIGCLYLIIRNKKGNSSGNRLNELFSDVVFNKMKEIVPNYLQKVVLVEGDTSARGLGLSVEDRNLIKDKINVVFHCAASMNMDATLKVAVATNIRGLYELIDICQEINNLKSFLFVSTAFSNCIHHVIEEKFYDAPIQATTLMKFTEDVSENILENIKSRLIGDWPNPYCFSKAIAEDMFYQKGKNLPIGLFRPSIIMPIYKEPFPGWSSNIYGPIGIMIATGLGLLRVFICNPNLKCDMVPVDYCVNSLICAAWEVHENSKNKNRCESETNALVYNYTSGPDQHITWSDHTGYSLQYKYPLKNPLWATVLLQVYNKYLYYLLWFFLHTIPAYAIDMYLKLSGRKPKMIKTYKKLFKFSKVLSYFTTNEWNFINQNVKQLWYKLNEDDKKLFPFDMTNVDHKQLVSDACTGVKIYVLKETLDNVEDEIKRYRKLLFLHYLTKYVLQGSALVLIFFILQNLFL